MQELTKDSLDEIEDNFKYFDKDENGLIDQDEFAELLKVLSPNIDAKQIATGFNIVDENSDGYIDHDEFVTWWRSTWWEY